MICPINACMNISWLIHLAVNVILVATGNCFKELFIKELFNIQLDKSYA